jgi:steroid 5-alpha reductase family enzyme
MFELSWCPQRHPNYFGEFTLWLGQFLLCANAFTGQDGQGAFVGAGWLCCLSPLFVLFLLNCVSGVPILEKSSDARWGEEAAYQEYKKETWSFWLLPARRTAASKQVEVS